MGYNENDNQFGSNPNGGYSQPDYNQNANYGQPANGFSQSGNYGQPANGFSQSGNYGQPANDFSQSGNYGQPANDFSQSGNYSQPANDFSQQANGFGQSTNYGQPANDFSQNANYGQPANDFSQNANYGQPANNYGQGGNNGQPAYSPYQQPQKQPDGLGIASLVMGIASLTCIFSVLAIPGLICGIIGKAKNKNSKTAIGGMITSAIGLVILVIICAVGIPTYLKAKKTVEEVSDAASKYESDFYDAYDDILDEVESQVEESADDLDDLEAAADAAAAAGATAGTTTTVDGIDGVHFTLNDVEFAIGESKPADFTDKLGWEFDKDDLETKIGSNQCSYVTYFLNDDYDSVYLYFMNLTDSELPMSDCVLNQIVVTANDYQSGGTIDFVTISTGPISNTTSESDFLSTMGEADYVYDGSEFADEGTLKEYSYYEMFDYTYTFECEFNKNGMCEFSLKY